MTAGNKIINKNTFIRDFFEGTACHGLAAWQFIQSLYCNIRHTERSACLKYPSAKASISNKQGMP